MFGLKVRELAVWIAYSVMLGVVVPWHEPWSDESQAWLLARDLSIRQLLFHNLRYESHPALWYLILWGPSHLHMNYAVLGWISATIAAAGIYVLLRFSPFPFYLRAILPFTFFLAYQYAVVARSYVLFPLLCFLIAHIYRQVRPRPVLMAVLLALLANVSVHGTLVACTLAAVYSWNLYRRGRTAELTSRTLASAAVIFTLSIVFVAITIYPPNDLQIKAPPIVSRVIHSLSIPPTPDAPTQDQSAAPHASQLLAAGATTTPQLSQKNHLAAHLADIPRVLTYAVSTSHILTFFLYLLVVVYLFSRKQLLLLAPLAILTLFLEFIYAREWHLGLLWIVLLMTLWAAWDAGTNSRRLNLQNALAAVLALVSLLQLPWTWNAIRYDIHSQYWGSKQAAAYIHTLPPGLRVAGFGTEPIAPYFSKHIFYNQPSTAFVLHSAHNDIFDDDAETIETYPDVAVFWSGETASIDIARSSGYHETHRFCGKIFLPNVETEVGCYIFLEPSGRPAPRLPKSIP